MEDLFRAIKARDERKIRVAVASHPCRECFVAGCKCDDAVRALEEFATGLSRLSADTMQ